MIEVASAASFILTALGLASGTFTDSITISYFWIIMFGIFGLLQSVSLVFRRDLIILRICMAWISGSLWSWMTYINYDHILHIPVLVIGICNLYAFAYLTNHVSIDWNQYFKEEAK